ncbi:YjhX family toxin [Salinarimonas sp.]|uniref:YjhX family toxin n=1 Tax=Salinarimonas sp. TaxID=2766526 RepID=UPI0032D99A3C
MNVSKTEQRVLHALAQGGFIRHIRSGSRIVGADCFNREGHRLAGFTLDLFERLRRRGLIASRGGRPYRISQRGLGAVRAQLDNR